MKPIRVGLKDRSYDIAFGPLGPGFISALKKAGLSSSQNVLIVTSRSLQKNGHLAKLVRTLRAGGFHGDSIVLPNGESVKNLNTLQVLLSAGAQAGLDRKSFVVALGGGVITDLAGFFAASYMRGISYVSLPTTLLGMVDASIGGKTGVDLPEGKNLAGAFWQPRLVWIDPGLLKTLPSREFRTGFAEVVKYGVIKDADFFSWLEKTFARKQNPVDWSSADILKALYRSAQLKAQVVGGDERETPLGGGREILNFGHTGGHALEAAYNYRGLSHGEAISIGMNLAGRIAIAQKKWSLASHWRMLSLLKTAGLPTECPRMDKKQKKVFWSALAKDKKHVGGYLRFVLPIRMGKVIVKSGIPIDLVRRALAEITR